MKKVLFFIAPFIMATLLGGCYVPIALFEANEVERMYIQSAWSEKTEFIMNSNEDADLAWRRAQVFVAQYATRISLIEPFVIKTVMPLRKVLPDVSIATEEYVPIHYTVTRLKEKNHDEFCVVSYSSFAPLTALLNSKILVHYMKTGKIIPRIVSRNLEQELLGILDITMDQVEKP